jgi:hypothetical protein
MKTYTYRFSDWSEGYIPEDAPPDSILDNLPKPPKFRAYRPAWGKGSKSAEKAIQTRNQKTHLAAIEQFRREVLPIVRPLMDAQSLFETGLEIRDADLIDASGFRYWHNPETCCGAWLANGDAKEPLAAEKGASPVTSSQALALLKP